MPSFLPSSSPEAKGIFYVAGDQPQLKQNKNGTQNLQVRQHVQTTASATLTSCIRTDRKYGYYYTPVVDIVSMLHALITSLMPQAKQGTTGSPTHPHTHFMWHAQPKLRVYARIFHNDS